MQHRFGSNCRGRARLALRCEGARAQLLCSFLAAVVLLILVVVVLVVLVLAIVIVARVGIGRRALAFGSRLAAAQDDALAHSALTLATLAGDH